MESLYAPAKMPLARPGYGFSAASDDTPVMKQILETHAPDGRDSSFDVKPLLQIVEEVLYHSTAHISWITQVTRQHMETLDDKTMQFSFNEMLKYLTHTISTISCEISCKCSGGADVHTTTKAICTTLSSYTWEAKVVIALAAFAIIYGEFWLLVQLYLTNPLAKSVAYLKQLPDTFERIDLLKPKLEALTQLIKAMMDVTNLILKFRELPSQYITPTTPALVSANAYIPQAVYWTIRGIVISASQIMNIVGMGHEYTSLTTEVTWELSTLTHKLKSNIHEYLQSQLNGCYNHIEEKRNEDTFQTIIRVLSSPHTDNMKVLQILISGKADQPPLYYGHDKRLVNLEELRKKVVLLFISDLDLIPEEEFWILRSVYDEKLMQPTTMESQFEIVWLPVVDRTTSWDTTKIERFETLKTSMPWYSVKDPLMVETAVIRYIKEYWKFNKKPLLVALDANGKMVNINAIHMIYIWGSLAFPFTRFKEEALWKDEESWKLSLLADSIHRSLNDWVSHGKYICLYGGDDILWIRKFTDTIKTIVVSAKIEIEMLYVGKSNMKEKIRKNNSLIVEENLGHILQDTTLVSYFWARLNSMWHSKLQLKVAEDDPIMQEIKMILSYNSSEQGWAVISRGTAEMTKAPGDLFIQGLLDYNIWKEEVLQRGFVGALDWYLRERIHPPHHCTRLILPSSTGDIPERVVCAECRRPMEKFVMYRCCVD